MSVVYAFEHAVPDRHQKGDRANIMGQDNRRGYAEELCQDEYRTLNGLAQYGQDCLVLNLLGHGS